VDSYDINEVNYSSELLDQKVVRYSS